MLVHAGRNAQIRLRARNAEVRLSQRDTDSSACSPALVNPYGAPAAPYRYPLHVALPLLPLCEDRMQVSPVGADS